MVAPTYTLFSAPEPLSQRPPKEWSRKEANDYLEWFLAAIPDRLAQLRAAVAYSDPSAGADLDLSRASLVPLGRWLAGVVDLRPLNTAETRQDVAGMPSIVPASDVVLTDVSLSLAGDIGIYLGETFRRQTPQARWAMVTRPRSDVSFHRPVIEGLAPIQVDPILVSINVAQAVATRRRGPEALSDAYDYWATVGSGSG